MQQNIGPSFIALELGGGIASTYALQVNPSYNSVTHMSWWDILIGNWHNLSYEIVLDRGSIWVST